MTSLDLILAVQREIESEQERLTRYKRLREYYNGDHDQPLPVRMGQADDNVILNHARYIVDESVALLFGQDVPFELEEGKMTKAEEHLKTVWLRNQKMTLLGKAGTTGSIYGHLFLKIVPDKIEQGIPRIVTLEPEYMSVLWDDEDIDEVLRYRMQWSATGRDGRPLYRRQDMYREAGSERWLIENRISRGYGDWEQDPRNPDVTWGYPWSPIIDCQNLPMAGEFYGLSDLEDLSEQDAMNYVASKYQRITRYHAHPKTLGAGFRPADIKLSEDDMTVLPSPESKVWNLEMQSDGSTMLAWLRDLRDQFYQQTRTPNLDPSKVSVGALSGFALRILYGPALSKLEMKRRTYGDMLIELNRRLLDLGGFGDDNRVTVHWQDPLPTDEAAEKERDEFELGEGLASKETVATRRGLDWEVEKERIEAERAESGNVGAQMVKNFMNAQGMVQQQRQGPMQQGQPPQQGQPAQPGQSQQGQEGQVQS